MSCGVGLRCGSDLELLWLWRRPAATAPIRPLAREPPQAVGAAQEMAKRQKKEKKTKQIKVQTEVLPDQNLIAKQPSHPEYLTVENRELSFLIYIPNSALLYTSPYLKINVWKTNLHSPKLKLEIFHSTLGFSTHRIFRFFS